MNRQAEIKDVLRQMLAVMEEERQGLAALDIDAIVGCTTRKSALCEELIDASNDNLDDETIAMIDAARRLNEVNRQVRNLVAANVAARLDALTGAPTVYNLQGARAGYARHSTGSAYSR